MAQNDKHHWRSEDDRDDEAYRATEHYGGGQSGYGAGRFGNDRSMGPSFRNQESRGYGEDRQLFRTDERFEGGRGGEGYWEDQTERRYGNYGDRTPPVREDQTEHTGYASGYNRGQGYGNYGERTQPFRGGRGGAQLAHDYNERRGYPDVQRYGDRTWGMQSGPMQGNLGPDLQRGGHRGKGPVGYERSDERIREEVCEALSDDDHVDASHIEVVVKNGEVILTGTVEDRYQKRRAEDCIEHLPGVHDVQNQLRVRDLGNRNQGSAVGRSETDMSSEFEH